MIILSKKAVFDKVKNYFTDDNEHHAELNERLVIAFENYFDRTKDEIVSEDYIEGFAQGVVNAFNAEQRYWEAQRAREQRRGL